jgi:type IV pilus assembly protein PilQ
MDEKKISGLAVAMNKSIGIFHPVVFIAAFMVLLTVVFSPGSPAEAARKPRRDIPPGLTMDAPVYPLLAGVQVSQMGAHVLRISFRGFEIPTPRAASAPGEAKLVLQWDGARFPQTTDKNDWWTEYDWDLINIHGKTQNRWWKEYDKTPLLNRIDAVPVDEDSIRLIFTTTQPVVIDRVDGVAGADELIVVLKVYEPDKAPEPAAMPRQYEKGDPMLITTPVTFALQDAGVKDVFRMLADMQKPPLNLLLDPSVPDMPVSFSFAGVPFNEVFGYFLRIAELSYAVKGGTLIVGKPESLGKTLGTEVTKVYRISYAVDQEGQVRGDFTATLTGLVSLSKTPVLDARSRELYVTATEEQHKEVAAILEKIDHPGRQVVMEVRIFEVIDNASEELETLINAVYDNWLVTFNGSSGLRGGYAYQNTNGGIFDLDDFQLPFPGGNPPYWTDPIIGDSQRALTAGLNALETQGKGKNLANPHVMTMDGEEAIIELVQNVKYVTGVDSNGNVQFGEVKVGPQLRFLPIIGRDGVVTIDIEIETGELLGWRSAGMGAQAPETSSRRVQTNVRVRNGEPFVVGGLYQDNRTKARNRVPVLGYIPLLGELFTYRSDSHRRTEVAMIVVPYILDIPNNIKMEMSEMGKMSNLN